MKIKKLSDKAVIPSKGSKYAAGYDLYAIESYELKPGERKAFKTGISLAIPTGCYGRIAPRSGLAVKNGIDVLAGVIDSDYRGEILVALINLGQEPITLPLIKNEKETAIAQIIFETHTTHDFKTVDDLDETERGEGGFSSTDPSEPTVYKSFGGVPFSATKSVGEELSKNKAPSLIEMYESTGGIITKSKYTEELKRNNEK